MRYYFDLETFPNIFTFCGKFEDAVDHQMFEISDRMNQREELRSWLDYLKNAGVQMIGFNNINFDYPIVHELMCNPFTFDATKANQMGTNIIFSQRGPGGNFSAVRLKDRFIQQVDLWRINHFDNPAKNTSLKALQFAMRAQSVEDMPFEVRRLTFDEMDVLRRYNLHDVLETERFGKKCIHLIKMRQELIDNGVLKGDVLNYSDVRIGTEYLVSKIGRSNCFKGKFEPKQTMRDCVRFKDIILNKIYFRTERFDEVLNWFASQVVWIGGEEKPSAEFSLAGLDFHFGLGGVHASVENKKFESNETHVIKDIDVSGMYVAVAIANGFFPKHLGQDFVTAYRQLQADRKQYAKKTSMNLVLKLAGNGVYGNSNNIYSCFYDPQYTFSTTVNGQLQLIQLAEVLSLIPGLQLIQANTDGITALVPRELEYLFDIWKDHWECETGLKLEEVEYSKMWIRDVNNYVAIDTKGNVKRKGAYAFPVKDEDYWGGSGSEWHKDFSNLTAQKGVEQVMLNGVTPIQALLCMSDPFDFMCRYKTPGGSKVYIDGVEQAKTLRYYVSTKGGKGKKVSKPKHPIGDFKRKNSLPDSYFNKILASIPKGTWDERIHTKNKTKYEEVTTSIESGYLIKECNRAEKFDWNDVDYKFYAEQIQKLVIGEKK